LGDKLRSWVEKHNISHNDVNNFSGILKTEGLCVPKDIRTLMETPKLHKITAISKNSYIHLGKENMLSP